MTMHDERWTLGMAENGDVRLRDLKTGQTLRFGGSRGLFDALGKLADWRETPVHNRQDDVPRGFLIEHADHHAGVFVDGCTFCTVKRDYHKGVHGL